MCVKNGCSWLRSMQCIKNIGANRTFYESNGALICYLKKLVDVSNVCLLLLINNNSTLSNHLGLSLSLSLSVCPGIAYGIGDENLNQIRLSCLFSLSLSPYPNNTSRLGFLPPSHRSDRFPRKFQITDEVIIFHCNTRDSSTFLHHSLMKAESIG